MYLILNIVVIVIHMYNNIFWLKSTTHKDDKDIILSNFHKMIRDIIIVTIRMSEYY